uniref:Uncharacterized protein n=1 Tax=Cacopsylla melanoneura TaxID=428564 RepID=A0A8D9AVE9_9HEMI
MKDEICDNKKRKATKRNNIKKEDKADIDEMKNKKEPDEDEICDNRRNSSLKKNNKNRDEEMEEITNKTKDEEDIKDELLSDKKRKVSQKNEIQIGNNDENRIDEIGNYSDNEKRKTSKKNEIKKEGEEQIFDKKTVKMDNEKNKEKNLIAEEIKQEIVCDKIKDSILVREIKSQLNTSDSCCKKENKLGNVILEENTVKLEENNKELKEYGKVKLEEEQGDSLIDDAEENTDRGTFSDNRTSSIDNTLASHLETT